MYGKLIDGKLVYAPKNYLTDDNRMIFNFNNNVELMKNNGFKEVEDIVPSYDATTHYVLKVGYNEDEDKIVVNYEVLEKELTYAEKLTSQQELAMSFLADNLTDEQALDIPLMFPKWRDGAEYKENDRVRYLGKIYKVVQAHTAREGLQPDISPDLFEKVVKKVVEDNPQIEILEWEKRNIKNPYMKGDKVTYQGKTYVSKIDINLTTPRNTLSGWEEIANEH